MKAIPIILSLTMQVAAPGLFGADLIFNVDLASLTAHNTSANPTYDQGHFPENFGTDSDVSPTESTTIDPARMDKSMHPVTPGHVSGVDVHTLIPSRPDLRWFAHLMGWWGSGSPFNVGLDVDTDDYAKALVTDLMNRGFNGVIVCWNSPGSRDDSVVRRIQAFLKTLPPGSFTFIVLVDQGLVQGKPDGQQLLLNAVEYCKTQYFTDPNYEKEDGKPVLMFYGVREILGQAIGEEQAEAAMAAVKSTAGGNMVWATMGKTYITSEWADQTFDWHNFWPEGVNPNDPYNLHWVAEYYDNWVRPYPRKEAFGAMCAAYNGTLSAGRTKGCLPGGSGACLIQRAQVIDQKIPSNVTRMQWVTWNDYSEGTSVEPGIENDAKVTAKVQGSMLNWTVTSGTGDESTIDHYQIYASADGINAADLGSVPAGKQSFDLGAVRGLGSETTYQIVVVAVGRPCIRDHAGNAVAYTPKVSVAN